jgi:hypothetical protein
VEREEMLVFWQISTSTIFFFCFFFFHSKSLTPLGTHGGHPT